MERRLTRGEIWFAEVGRKRRPVVVLTRSEVIDVRDLVTVVEITTSARGLAAEVALDQDGTGLDRSSSINCDGLHTVARSSLTAFAGAVSDDTMGKVCAAVSYAIGC